MSYCRWGADSDVYVYASRRPELDDRGRIAKLWVCCRCKLNEPGDRDSGYHTERGMLEHLLAHRAAGDKVPEDALERLRKEMASGS